jgi:hypothetical protein
VKSCACSGQASFGAGLRARCSQSFAFPRARPGRGKTELANDRFWRKAAIQMSDVRQDVTPFAVSGFALMSM